MIKLTGDTHGKFNRIMNPGAENLIILGDFGGVFNSKPHCPEDENEKSSLNILSKIDTNFIIVGGNHENWKAIEANYSIDQFCGAKARYIRDNIIWIERGEILNLEGNKLWCFAGARSDNRIYENSWSKREQATESEYDYAYNNLLNSSVDYLLTHDMGSIKISELPHFRIKKKNPSKTQKFLDDVDYLTENKIPHYCGHFHTDATVKNTNILYQKIVNLGENSYGLPII